MKYYLEGKKELKLTGNDIVASGGEGTVYKKNKTAYKIYHESAKAISPLKIDELQVLNRDTIISPDKIVTDENNRTIGYSMAFIKDTVNLCRLFSSGFQKKNGITRQQIMQLIEGFQKDLEYVHSKNILIVDLNEMNFLADSSFSRVYFIDVDSYQTPGFKAPVIMDSIRDRHSQGFSRLTDWFSWAIVTFQLLTGIHPYKGKHSQIKTLDERMQQNISVFNPAVRVPGACTDFKTIPEVLQKWYYRLFEQGARDNPPLLGGITVISSPAAFTIEDVKDSPVTLQLIREMKEKIIHVEYLEGKSIIKTEKAVVIDSQEIRDIPPGAHFTGSPGGQGLLACWLDNNSLKVYDTAKGTFVPCRVEGEQMMSRSGRIYLKSFETVTELTFLKTARDIKVVPRTAGQVMEHATTAYDGVFFQRMLDTCFATIFPGQNRCYHIKITELADYRIIDAAYESKVLMIIGYKDDKYDRFILRFDDNFSTYDIRKIKNIEMVDLNLVVLDHGAGIYKNDEEKLELFPNVKDSRDIKVISDGLLGPVTLYKDGTKLLGTIGSKLYRLTMENKK